MTNKHHGISYGLKSQEEGLEFYTCFTLFDITNTGVIMPFNESLPAFIDTAGQPVFNEKTWDRSRNQQRNWDTVVQIISLRAQPIILQSAILEEADLDYFKFGNVYSSMNKVWKFRFGIEAKEAFRKGTDPVGALADDSHLVPLSVGLTEKLSIEPACIITKGSNTNTYFEYGYKI